ncbi:Exodeoxyribonuclease 7 large subunit [Fusobacterium sp. DD29]|uniref:exodeoxyribonuclease VII large subunit n=1 Tax=unclassified Fusobacterium TaxID=2648384 RepID=UPI001B8D8D9D|nr:MULTISPECIES: exodeoxyribonuclease VII large subunit [unclassified Fusobacterium]MBR8749061.1 Exodeoxyribonuclease 7 large subunit [Fusobacterium sp. DD29]MBR8761327.1 Exodeoxyribonuclease 7 large subunit [Fusobacterium sp. DD25]MBR8767320.1 Exodeoxyribonuclease 7 large subunit [Fusobacterium sp. DD43]MBR8771370.1 Exodeoxyribonuclease 7 large subunit [Fusobacterium sp. DD40]MBR8775616.1 Exodeoxyribonuclease 7 large subunit [Fusobacterium sp. DD17]
MFEERTYTVTELNKRVKGYLEGNSEFREFFLEGEMSGVTYYKSGHLYFNLKDKNAQVKCAAFSYKFKKIPEDLKDGDAVKLFGDVGFYEARGDFQVLVRHIEKQSKLGQMYAELEKVKKEMEKAGYFDPSKKKPLPSYPKNIGVVTALTGAAVQDIIKTIKKRDDRINIYVYPAKVQGTGSKEEIVKGIEVLNRIPEIDLIIAGRGGGSAEDLWAFNERETAMAYFNSEKPIISAVGHEVDFMLTDLTADARAATPTQAVEMSVPEKVKSVENVQDRIRYVRTLLLGKVERMKKELRLREENYYIKNFSKTIEEKNQSLIDREKEIKSLMELSISKFQNEFDKRIHKLMALNPLSTLERGYSVATKGDKVIKSVEDIEVNDEMNIKVLDGTIKGIVKEKIYEKNID